MGTIVRHSRPRIVPDKTCSLYNGTMRAWIYPAVGEPPRLIDLPDPTCPPDGAVVAVRATGVCRSDWHAWRGHDPVALPHVPGHEFAGVVAELGSDVSGFALGERVTAPFVHGCGTCEECRSGQAQVCPRQSQPGFTHYGSFADLVVVRHAMTNLVRLPDGLDFATAASLGCRFATAYHALTAQSRLAAGEWLAVVGCGGVGLSAIDIAHALGAHVVAVDPSPGARALARELGADLLVDPTADDPVAATRRAVGGVHVSMDAVGSASTARTAVALLRRRGRHVQVGLMLGADSNASLDWATLVAQELTVSGSHGMAAADYPALLSLVAERRVHPERLVGSVIGFDRLGPALTALDGPTGAGITVATLP